MNGWMDGGRGHSRRLRKKDEMKVELTMKGLIEEEQGRTSKNII